jgi:hypothetical protein
MDISHASLQFKGLGIFFFDVADGINFGAHMNMHPYFAVPV